MAAVIKQNRAAKGLSQAQLAALAGVDARQIRRYEAGEQQPVLSVAVAIADALGISLSELAGQPTQRLDLTGDWYASWQSYLNGDEVHRTQPVRIGPQRGDILEVAATARGDEVARGGFLWKGELRLWDNEILIGWYAATEGSVRSKGALYYALHPHGQEALGRWVGLSHDGLVVTGFAGLARDSDRATTLIEEMHEQASSAADDQLS